MLKLSEGLNEYLLDCKVRNYSEETINIVKLTVGKFIRMVGNISLEEVTSGIVKKYILECKETSKASTINTQLRNIKGMFKYYVQEEVIERNPFDGVQLLKEEKNVMRTYSTDVVLALLENLDGHSYIAIRNKTIATF